MPQTNAYTVDWTVAIYPEGDVSEDVMEVTVVKEEGVNSATVVLDTSERPHAIQEQADINILLSDGNDSIDFDGYVDDVNDADDSPEVTIDARTPAGRLDDVSLVGDYSADTLFGVVEEMVDGGPSKIRKLSFDADDHRAEYETFAGSTIFGNFDIAHWSQFGVSYDYFEQQETLQDRGKQAQLNIDYYENTTGVTFVMDVTGMDGNGNEVKATIGLPPGDSPEEAFGTARPKLALSGGNGRLAKVTDISTDVGELTAHHVGMNGTIQNYVDTDFSWATGDDATVRDGVEFVTDYIGTLDKGNQWTYYVDAEKRNLVLEPDTSDEPAQFMFREGDNVMRPMATRNIDGVHNFVKVSGSGSINCWAWAYGGDFYYALDNPLDNGEYPTSGTVFGSSGGVNDIDEIDLRADTLESAQISNELQAINVAQEALENRYRASVSGTAPVPGIKDVTPGDRAEVFYPSRGIPQRVVDNVFTVKKVEFQVSPDEAKTAIDFGVKRPTAEEIIKQIVSRETADTWKPKVGRILKIYEDGTAKIATENGETYDRVRVI